MNNNKITAILGIIAVLLILIVVIISYIQILDYYPNFNLLSNWMSELAVGPNKILLNLAIMISSLLLLVFVFGFLKFIEKDIGSNTVVKFCLFSGILSLIGLFLIGFFPMEDIGRNNLYHGLSAIVYWTGSILFWNFLSKIFRDNPDIDKTAMILTNLTCIAWFVFGCSFIAVFISETFPVIFQWIAHIFNLITFSYLALWMIKE